MTNIIYFENVVREGESFSSSSVSSVTGSYISEYGEENENSSVISSTIRKAFTWARVFIEPHNNSAQNQRSDLPKISPDSNDNIKEAPTNGNTPPLTTYTSDVLSSDSLQSFSFSDLRAATRNFHPDSFLGEGGFGCVYKGWIDANTYAPTRPGVGIIVAIKKLKIEAFQQGDKEWLAEVNYLGLLRHDNLVKLIGYCSELDNRLLVYEFMPMGSLENHLFRRNVQPINWATRMRIAIDVSRGLAFLHNSDKNVIYPDLNASNILLDYDFNAKLSDFGLARYGLTGEDSPNSGWKYALPEKEEDDIAFDTWHHDPAEYADPVCFATGHVTTKSNVYSFGVVLLELLTGKRAYDEDGPVHSRILVDWAKPLLKDNRSVLRIMDTRLRGQYSKRQAQAFAGLIGQCLDYDPKNRPTMKELYTTLQELQNSANLRRIPNGMKHRGTKHSTHHQKVPV